MEWRVQKRTLMFMVNWLLTGRPDNVMGERTAFSPNIRIVLYSFAAAKQANSLSPPHGEFWSWDDPKHCVMLGQRARSFTSVCIGSGSPPEGDGFHRLTPTGEAVLGRADSWTLHYNTPSCRDNKTFPEGARPSQEYFHHLEEVPSCFLPARSQPLRGNGCFKYLSPWVSFG